MTCEPAEVLTRNRTGVGAVNADEKFLQVVAIRLIEGLIAMEPELASPDG